MSPRSFVVRASLLTFFTVFLYVFPNASFLYRPYMYQKQAYSTATAAKGEWRSESDTFQPSSSMSLMDGDDGLVAATTTATTGSLEAYATQSDAPSEAPSVAIQDDKVIVIGRLQDEDTTWVQEHLPDWQSAIYTVDNTSAPLHTPYNKGREANAYLLYIIQHYDNLPSTIAFLHPHHNSWPAAWHTDAADYDNVLAMNTLRLDFVQRNGYVNLRCNWNPGCPDAMQSLRDPDGADPHHFERHIPEAWRHFFGEASVVPNVVATPCCAQFAVSREQVLKRPLEDYKRYHQWLMDTPLSDYVSGRILEYLWHVIFGKDTVYCPDMHQCYQDVYGRDS